LSSDLRILVHLVIYDSGLTSLEYLLLSGYNSQREPTLSLSTEPLCCTERVQSECVCVRESGCGYEVASVCVRERETVCTSRVCGRDVCR